MTPLLAMLVAAPAVGLSPTITMPQYWSWARTPVMGWNSYDAFGDTVTEEEVLANAEVLRDRLSQSGWRYVVVDFRWYDPEPIGNDVQLVARRTGAKLTADAYGRLLPAPNRFPSAVGDAGFEPLIKRIHAMGLKFGIHIMRGIPRQSVLAARPIEGSRYTAADAGNEKDVCGWCPDMFGANDNEAGQAWYDALFKQYARWGIDFVKVDDFSSPYHKRAIEMVRTAIDRCGHKIILSTSAGPTDLHMAAHVASHANQWRISGDFWDDWEKLDRQFEHFHDWSESGQVGPGHFADGDMIPFGRLAIRSAMGGSDHMSHFSLEERRTLLSLWALESSPLILGGHLPDFDASTLADLENKELISIDQDPIGAPAKRAYSEAGVEVWVKPLKGSGRYAIGAFNRSGKSASLRLDWQALSLSRPKGQKNVWQGTTVRPGDDAIRAEIPPHGVVLWLAERAT